MLNSEFIKDKFFDKYIYKVEFAEMLRIVPGNLQECYLFFCRNITYYSAQKCYIFPTPYIGIGMAIYDSFKLAYFLLNDRFLYIWAALISKISSSDKLLATKSRTMRFAISTFFILNEI